MIESFVDLTYRGLPLGRRIKLTQVRPASGYLEMPAPMPVGTHVVLATDEGHAIDAVVTAVKEQVAGADRAPGMTVAPSLGVARIASWWQGRVALPPEPEPVSRPKPVTVRPRSSTVPTDPPTIISEAPVPAADIAAALRTVVESAAAAPAPEGKRTTVMAAVDQELLAQLTKDSNIELFKSAEHPIVDDGNRTTVMTAIDPAALGLDAGDSGPMPAAGDDGDGDKSKSPRRRRGKKKP